MLWTHNPPLIPTSVLLPATQTDIFIYDAPAAPCPTNYYNIGVHDRNWGHDMSVQYVSDRTGACVAPPLRRLMTVSFTG